MKNMTITYVVENSLYINLTNRCSNRCDFCIRNNGDGAYGSDSLWLEHEPTENEIMQALEERNIESYDEIVFCGYGEPTERLETLVSVAKKLKAKHNCKIRVNTNGQSDLLYGKDTAPMFKDAVDTVSISLNAPSAEKYDRLCHPKFGLEAWPAILRFTEEVKQYVPDVTMSVVGGTIPEQDVDICRQIAQTKLGVKFRVR